MNLRMFLLSISVLLAFTQSLNALNTRLSILRQSGSVTHQWKYMPTGEEVTQQGLKSKQYPLVLLPSATYIESEMINIEGCDLEMSISYFVATSDTHSVKVELIDENDCVIYSYYNEDFQASSQLSGGATMTIGILPNAKKAKIRVSLSDAYNNNEAINVKELQLYSKNGAGINTISTNGISVKSESHKLIVSSDKNTSLEIITTRGAIVKKCAIFPGENHFSLYPGIYIIKIGTKAHKISIP